MGTDNGFDKVFAKERSKIDERRTNVGAMPGTEYQKLTPADLDQNAPQPDPAQEPDRRGA